MWWVPIFVVKNQICIRMHYNNYHNTHIIILSCSRFHVAASRTFRDLLLCIIRKLFTEFMMFSFDKPQTYHAYNFYSKHNMSLFFPHVLHRNLITIYSVAYLILIRERDIRMNCRRLTKYVQYSKNVMFTITHFIV